LRHLDLLLHSPWLVELGRTAEFPKAGTATVHIANPAALIAQKLLINAKRSPADRAKDILYIHDTIETFGSSLDQIRTEWDTNLSKHMHSNAIRSINHVIKSLFGEVNGLTREAALMAIGRRLAPRQIVNVCETGLSRIFS
jgi:hypothetical protein